MMSRTYSRISTRSNYGTPSSRITRTNLLALRTAQMKEDSVRKMVGILLNEIRTAFFGLFAVRQAKTNSMCKYYGHVIHGNTWQGYLPKCGDCGCEISSPDQLRKSSPVQA